MTDADPCQRKSKAGEKCGILFNRCGTGYTCSGSICKPTIIDVDDIMKLINDANIVQLKELLKEIKPLEEERIKKDISDHNRYAIINDTDCKGFTPLMRAAMTSDDIISTLLEYSANKTQQHKGDKTKITWVKNDDKLNETNNTALMYAVNFGNIDNVRALLQNNDPAINLQATDGTTALMIAKTPAIVQLLLRKGADSTIKNKSGQTARDIYLSSNKLDLVTAHDSYLRTPRGLYSRTNKEKLGQGTFGEVFKVKRNGENVVLKRFILDDSIRTERNTIETTKKNSFANERDIFRKFTNSKYVMKYLNSETSENSKTGFIVTELLKGKELIEAIKERLINNGNIQQITEDLLMGLDEIHRAGVLHLDIKPENIWFMKDPGTTIKYFDFGLSCDTPCVGPIRGSPGYTKPDKDAIRMLAEDAIKRVKNKTMPVDVANKLIKPATNAIFDKTDDFYALARTLTDILIGFGKTEEEIIRNNNVFDRIAEGGEWAMTDVFSVESQKRLAGVIQKLVKLTPTQNAIDALTPTAGGRRRFKTQRRCSQQQKQRRQSRRN
jgi:hypothetical protein